MKAKYIYGTLAALIAAALVVTVNILFRGNLPTETVVLNIVVSLLILTCFAWPLFVKWDRSGDAVGTWVGSLGITLWGLTTYAILALIALLAMNVTPIVQQYSETCPIPFKYQILVQGVLLLLLLATRFFSHAAGGQVEKVYQKEESLTAGPDRMRSAVRRLQDTVFVTDNVSPEVKSALDDIQAALRFLSPVQTPQARELEDEFVSKAEFIGPYFTNYKMNEESILKQLKLLRRVLDNRKQLYN